LSSIEITLTAEIGGIIMAKIEVLDHIIKGEIIEVNFLVTVDASPAPRRLFYSDNFSPTSKIEDIYYRAIEEVNKTLEKNPRLELVQTIVSCRL
jgi:hypothetical protein